MKRIAAILVLVWSVAALSQVRPDQLFQEANQAYDQKDYAAAVDKYKTLLQDGVANASVYYNLANTYFRLGNLGEAIWCYRKARKLSPNDRDLKENLEFARLYRVDKLAEANSSFLIEFLTGFPAKVGLSLLSWLVTLCWWLFLAGLFLYFIYKKRGRLILTTMIASLVLFLWLGSSLRSGAKAEQRKHAVVLAGQAEAKSGPGEDYVSLFSVHQGLECEVEEEREGWYLVYLPNGSRGWVPSKTLGLI
jgi:tetratricopeptide (TPR) repeat protein